ncbi:MAG: hypothetical protein B0D92_06635 [Spirochaeta sp. LUC14_002_19_P3]|nr:MAG: hypothetical protein B0D92_06635 [Spirochaeta sp. LUC14_002_19_P3]
MNQIIRCTAIFSFIVAFSATGLGAQETAGSYFNSISERYKSISDYTARLMITRGGRTQVALVQYKSPNLLRMDFSDPAGMVIAVDGDLMKVWVPEYSVTFEQTLRRNSTELASAATARGLELMARYYTVAYSESPNPVPLDPGSSERVIKLQLRWKSNNEGFRELEVSISPALKTIRRIRGITTSGERIVFDFTNVALNKDIPVSRFSFDSPPTGNTIQNFLFDPEE